MQGDVLGRRLEQFRHLRLRQPNGALIEPALNARLAVLGLVEDQAGVGRWFGCAHFSLTISATLPIPLRFSIVIPFKPGCFVCSSSLMILFLRK